MSRKFLTPIDLTKNELQNAVIQNLATAPSSPVSGQVYYDTSVNQLKVYEGTGWAPVGGVATGSGAPATTPLSIGSMYLDTTNSVLYVSNGTTSSANWIPSMPYGLVGTIANLSTAAAAGTSLTVARADHVHRHTDTDHSGIHLNALATATADYSMGGFKLTNVATPVSGTDAANKNYVDAAVTGVNVHDEVQAASIANVVGTYANGSTIGADGGYGAGATFTVTATGAFVLDGYTTVLNDRVLLKNQTTALQNGIYLITTAGTTGVSAVLTRATDADNNLPGDVTPGDFVFVTGGSTQLSTGWVQTTAGTATTPNKGIKLGTDSLTWAQFSGVGTYTASNGVTLTGTNFTFTPTTTGGLQTGTSGAAVLLQTTSGLATTSSGLSLAPTAAGGLTTDATGAFIKLATNSGLGTTSSGLAVGAGTGIVVSTGTVAIDTSVVTRKYATAIGDGTNTSITVTHNLNTQDVTVGVYSATSTYDEVMCDVRHATVNTVTLLFSVAPTTGQYRVVVQG